jgi:hypothetical protein
VVVLLAAVLSAAAAAFWPGGPPPSRPAAEAKTPAGPLSPEEAGLRMGQEVLVEMEVRSARAEKMGRYVFLNSRRDFEERGNFTILIPREALDPGEDLDDVADRYRHRRVRVRGRVEPHRGHPQLRVTDPHQIELVPPVR